VPTASHAARPGSIQTGETMSAGFTEEETGQLYALEESLWRRVTRFDVAHMELLLAADFTEFGRSGRVDTRDDMLEPVDHPINVALPLENFAVRRIADDVALITYTSRLTRGGGIEVANQGTPVESLVRT
jgi:hypothetical protein